MGLGGLRVGPSRLAVHCVWPYGGRGEVFARGRPDVMRWARNFEHRQGRGPRSSACVAAGDNGEWDLFEPLVAVARAADAMEHDVHGVDIF